MNYITDQLIQQVKDVDDFMHVEYLKLITKIDKGQAKQKDLDRFNYLYEEAKKTRQQIINGW